jgi:thiamine-monophosphate kinase
MTELNEREIVDLFVSRIVRESIYKGIRNDIVIIPLKFGQEKANLAMKCDMLVESTDVPDLMQPWQISRKSVLASVSDFAAKGIRPSHSLISIGIPKGYNKNDIESLIRGFQKASKEFKVEIIGGDTNQSKELVIDCTLTALIDTNTKNIPTRHGARPGDLIVVSGKFGYTSSAFKIIQSQSITTTRKFRAKALSSILNPKPNFKFGFSLASFFSSSMDSSDGLSASLYELAQQSNVDFLISNLPTSKDVYNFALCNSCSIEDLVFFGGEEYETVSTVRRSEFRHMKLKAKRRQIKMCVIGEVADKLGPIGGNVYLNLNTEEKQGRLLKNNGFMHFSS